MGYSPPHPTVTAFKDPQQQNVARRIYERLDNLEAVTNLQSFSGGRKSPAPPASILNVTTTPGNKGFAYVRIAPAQTLGKGRNPIAAPIAHWVTASPNPQFNSKVTDFGVTNQTYIPTNELGSGTFYIKIRPTFDGKTFGPSASSKVVIP